MSISSINPIRMTQIVEPNSPVQPANQTEKITKSFDQVLSSLSQSQKSTDELTSSLASGGNVDLHNVMIAAEENDVNFRVAIAIRDHLVDSYREVMRMSI